MVAPYKTDNAVYARGTTWGADASGEVTNQIVLDDTTITRGSTSWSFTRVFGRNDEPKEVISDALARVLKDDRRSALLLAYGRSGSGKTTTIKDVFSSFSNVVYENLPAGAILRVSIVALEFHLKRVYDLQCDRAELTWNRTKPLSDTARSYVVDNSADLIAHMLTIFDRRVTAATVSNANSSRSHTFLELNFEVEVAPRQFEAWGRFGILDLAGSEALDSAAPTIGLDKGIQAVYRTAAAEQKDRAAAQQRNDEGAAIRQELVGISALMRAYASALRSGKTLPNHSFQSSPFLHVLKPYLDRRSSIVGVITLSLWKQFESRQRDILDFGKILASLCTLWTQADRERVAKLRAVSGLKPREETESNHPALTESPAPPEDPPKDLAPSPTSDPVDCFAPPSPLQKPSQVRRRMIDARLRGRCPDWTPLA